MIFLLAEKPTQNFEEKTQLLSHIFSFITIASKFGKNPHFHLKPHSLHYLRPPSFSFSEEKRNRKTEEARFSPILLHFPPSFSPHLAAFQRQFALFFGRIFPICFTGNSVALQGAVFQFGLPYPAAVFVGLLVLSSHQQIPRRWMNSRFAEKIKISQMRLALLWSSSSLYFVEKEGEEEETVPIFHLSLFPHCCLTTKEKKITDDDPFVRPKKKSRLLKKSKIGRGPWSPENFGKLIYAPGRFAAAVMDVETAPPSPKPLGKLFRGRTTLIFPSLLSRKILGD